MTEAMHIEDGTHDEDGTPLAPITPIVERTFTQDEVNKIAASSRAEGRRANDRAIEALTERVTKLERLLSLALDALIPRPRGAATTQARGEEKKL